MFSKNATTLYQKINNSNNITYVSIKKQANYEIVIINGVIGQQPQSEIFKFSTKRDLDKFYEKTFKEYSITYVFQPHYTPKKIGFNLQGLNESEIIDIWFTFNEFIESQLFLSGNGYIPDDFYDEINDKWIHSNGAKNDIYFLNLFVIDFNYTLSAINQYLKVNEKVALIIFL